MMKTFRVIIKMVNAAILHAGVKLWLDSFMHVDFSLSSVSRHDLLLLITSRLLSKVFTFKQMQENQ